MNVKHFTLRSIARRDLFARCKYCKLDLRPAPKGEADVKFLYVPGAGDTGVTLHGAKKPLPLERYCCIICLNAEYESKAKQPPAEPQPATPPPKADPQKSASSPVYFRCKKCELSYPVNEKVERLGTTCCTNCAKEVT